MAERPCDGHSNGDRKQCRQAGLEACPAKCFKKPWTDAKLVAVRLNDNLVQQQRTE